MFIIIKRMLNVCKIGGHRTDFESDQLPEAGNLIYLYGCSFVKTLQTAQFAQNWLFLKTEKQRARFVLT